MNNQELVEFIKVNPSYLSDHAGRLIEKFGVTREQVKMARIHIKNESMDFNLDGLRKAAEDELTFSPTLTESNTNVDTGETKHTLLFDRPLTKEELEAHFHVDNINNKITNYWSILVKSGAGYATSVNIKNIAKDFNIDKADKILESFLAKEYVEREINLEAKEGENLLLLNVADFHLDKEDIGENDIEAKINTYLQMIRSILDYSKAHTIDRILYVVGNDYFNTDTIFNTTTKGTPQNVTMTWDKAYELGFDLQVYVLNLLQTYCTKLDVLHVSGNHDETKSYYMAYSLSRYFEKSDMRFLINAKSRKQYTFGETFFGFHHGNTSIDKLPLNFAKEFTLDWGMSKYHEIIVADKHHYKQYEHEGVRIHQMPSLTGVDNWHDKSNFNNSIQSALGMLYNSKKGKFAEYEVRI